MRLAAGINLGGHWILSGVFNSWFLKCEDLPLQGETREGRVLVGGLESSDDVGFIYFGYMNYMQRIT